MPVKFTIEDLRSPERLECVLQQFNRALDTLNPTPSKPSTPPTTPIDLNRLADTLAPILRGQLQSTGSTPLNLLSLLPSDVIRDTSANRTALYPPTNYPAGTLFFETDTSTLYIVSDSTGVNLWVAIAGAGAITSITGTANQVIVTGTTSVVLSTPQNIHTGATPQFARLGLGAAADATNPLTMVNSVGSDIFATISNQNNSNIDVGFKALGFSSREFNVFYRNDDGTSHIDAVGTNNLISFDIAGAPKVQISNTGNVGMVGKINKYNNVTVVGQGVPSIYGSGRSTAQTAAVASVATYTNGAADGSFLISANINVTTSTLHNFTVTVAYTDETNTARTLTLTFAQLAGTLVTAITNATGAGPYEGIPLHIRCKASTAITIATTGTFTTVVYNVEGYITQIG